MTVQDDVRRLSQLDGVYLGWSTQSFVDTGNPAPVTIWYKGRLQQANDGSWIFRSISADGTVVGVQLGPVSGNWASNETPATGISVTIQINVPLYQPTAAGPNMVLNNFANVYVQQQLPQELTN